MSGIKKWWLKVALLVALFALVGVFHYRAQIRDLQRRVGDRKSRGAMSNEPPSCGAVILLFILIGLAGMFIAHTLTRIDSLERRIQQLESERR